MQQFLGTAAPRPKPKPKAKQNQELQKKAVTISTAPPQISGGSAFTMAPSSAIPSTVSVTNPTMSIRDRTALRLSIKNMRDGMQRYAIGALQINFMSSEYIRKIAVVECRAPGFEGPLSINSPKMGSLDQCTPCMTCGMAGIECEGHLGFTRLGGMSFPNPLTLDLIAFVMQSVCANCGRLALPQARRDDPAILRLKGAVRLKAIATIVASTGSNFTCPRNLEISEALRRGELSPDSPSATPCPSGVLKYSPPRDVDNYLITVAKGKIESTVPVDYIQSVFRSIPPDDLAILGFTGDSHPLNFILDVLPVIPERNRPPVETDGVRRPDHITIAYETIVRENLTLEELLKQQSAGDRSVEERISQTARSLYFHVYHLFNNADERYKINREEAANTIGSRMSGKFGFCRQTAHGRRVNNSARSVAGAGVAPYGAIILPNAMRTLTFPEKVNRFNIDRIRRAAERGDVVKITRGSGPLAGIGMRYLKLKSDASTRGDSIDPPQIGDTVSRLAEEGDDAICNRQPTLHRHSFFAARAYFRPIKTIKVPIAVTKALNLDMDGSV